MHPCATVTPARIKELRALVEAGTKGPWRASKSWGPPIGTLRLPDEKRDANGNIFWGYSLAGCDERGAPILPTLGAVHNFPDHIQANAALIVAAVNELGPLLDEVERLRELVRPFARIGRLVHAHETLSGKVADRGYADAFKAACAALSDVEGGQ